MKKFTLPALCFIPCILIAQYNGTGSVTMGKARTVTENIFSCTGGRKAGLGDMTSSDGKTWVVPAVTHFSDNQFPYASDLYNACNGNTFPDVNTALSGLSGSDIITIDPDGELITAYIFADNYFELYVNGIPAGKDKVPFTPFNSSIVRFTVKRPFTIAMLLVDWEENLGLGSELNGPFACHPGDGGLVAVFKDKNNAIVAVTDQKWKAQTFYTSPIRDVTCPTESGNMRLTKNCSTESSQECSTYYALHWEIPGNAMSNVYDDHDWPAAKEYTNAEIGVNNKPAYTNFEDVFDDPNRDAVFIWSSNVILDNTVIVRYTVPSASSTESTILFPTKYIIYPNPAGKEIFISGLDKNSADQIQKIVMVDILGNEVLIKTSLDAGTLNVDNFRPGLYYIRLYTAEKVFTRPLLIQ